jgi:ABC-2 type transport system permease protein
VDRLARARRSVSLYVRILTAQIKAILEYQTDFWMMVFGAVLLNGAGFIFISTIFSRFPNGIAGWTKWQVVVIYALVFFAEGVGSLFFEGTWRMNQYVNRGELDFILLRPVAPMGQVMASDIGMNGLGNILLGGTLIGIGLSHLHLHWTVARVALAMLLLVSACATKVALNMATCSSAFWIQGGFNPLAFSLHQMGDMARYPVQIYWIGVKLALSVAIPFVFISVAPASALFKTGTWHWLGYATPLIAAYCIALSIFIFHRGLRRYESAGN